MGAYFRVRSIVEIYQSDFRNLIIEVDRGDEAGWKVVWYSSSDPLTLNYADRELGLERRALRLLYSKKMDWCPSPFEPPINRTAKCVRMITLYSLDGVDCHDVESWMPHSKKWKRVWRYYAIPMPEHLKTQERIAIAVLHTGKMPEEHRKYS